MILKGMPVNPSTLKPWSQVIACFLLVALAAVAVPAKAQTTAPAPTKSANAVVASVNGTKIYADLVDQLVSASVANGAKDTPELREAIKTELIARVALADEARKQGLDKVAATLNQLLLARDNVLSDAAIQKYAEKNPITPALLRAEYQRQLALTADLDQYLVSNIVVETEAQAQEVLKALKAGQSFEKLAKEKSLDSSRQNGASLGWVLAGQLIKPLDSVVVNLAKGVTAAAPIATQAGWQVIRVEDKRKFQAPTFEESQAQLLRGMLNNQRAEYVQSVLKAAKIEAK